jgi:hypothetical protein
LFNRKIANFSPELLFTTAQISPKNFYSTNLWIHIVPQGNLFFAVIAIFRQRMKKINHKTSRYLNPQNFYHFHSVFSPFKVSLSNSSFEYNKQHTFHPTTIDVCIVYYWHKIYQVVVCFWKETKRRSFHFLLRFFR